MPHRSRYVRGPLLQRLAFYVADDLSLRDKKYSLRQSTNELEVLFDDDDR